MMSSNVASADSRYRSVDTEPTEQSQQQHNHDPSSRKLLVTNEKSKDLKPKKAKHEQAKVAINKSRPKLIWHLCVHLLPVCVTFAILQLSFRQVYWQGAGQNDINEVLGVLQVAAKAHEILIVFSLSQLVLYHLQQELISPQGLPFGLFTSAYRVAMGSHPFSGGFLSSWRSILPSKDAGLSYRHWRALRLALIVLFATLIALAAGPASAIAVIPRLSWWPYHDLFEFYQYPQDPSHGSKDTPNFSMYIPEQLFPDTITTENLPGSSCYDPNLDTNGFCPYAGFVELLAGLNFSNTHPQSSDNITFDSPVSRRMSTFYGAIWAGEEVFESYTWTTSRVLTNYISLGWGENITDDVGAPYTVELKTQYGGGRDPVTHAYCESLPSGIYQRNATFFTNEYTEFNASSPQLDLRQIWNETTLNKPPRLLFEWKEWTDDDGFPIILGLVLQPGDDTHVANVSVCGVQAYWITSDMWTTSGSNSIVSSNFSWAAYSGDEAGKETFTVPPIDIRKSWADFLNIRNETGKPTLLETFIESGVSQQGDALTTPNSRIATILSRAVTDGLSRIGSEYKVNDANPEARRTDNEVLVCRNSWCSIGPFLLFGFDPTFPIILNGTADDYPGYMQQGGLADDGSNKILKSFPQPEHPEQIWTRISFPVKRYGYGYSFETVTIKVATAVLVLHAVVVMIHSILRLVSGLSYAYATSLGELVALAFNSKPETTLGATAAGISCASTWRHPTAVREVLGDETLPDRLELVIEQVTSGDDYVKNESVYRRPAVGKKYE